MTAPDATPLTASLSEDERRELDYLRSRNAELEEACKEFDRLRDELVDHKTLARALLDVSTDSILLLDATGAILTANEAAAMRYGMTVETMQGHNIFDLTQEDLRDYRRHWFRQCMDSRKQVRFKDASGRGTHYGHRYYPYFEPRTGTMRVAIFTRDITENEMAIKALRESEARYRAIVEDQTELICRYLPDGRLSFVNDAYARYYGKDPVELINTNFIPHIPEEDLEIIQRHIENLAPERPVTAFEHRIILPDGQVRWQQWSHRAVYDEARRVVEYQAVGQDITKRVHAEQELFSSRTFLRLIIDTVPNPIFVKDAEGRFTLVNKAMADIYGVSVGELLGQRGADFNPNTDEVERFLAEDQRVMDSQQPVFIPQSAITNTAGQTRTYAILKLPLPGERQVLGVATDITERLEAEAEREQLQSQIRQSQKIQALGTLAGGIAHDFNNMIFAILGFTRLALKLEAQRAPHDADEKLRDYLQQIQSAGMRASDLVRQILTFSRQTEQEKKPVALTPLIKEITKMLRATVPATVRFDLSVENHEAVVEGDPIQIHQVFMNLCTNAAHSMREAAGNPGGHAYNGALSIIMRDVSLDGAAAEVGVAHPDARQGDYVEVVVADTGHGIDPGIREKIFDPFFTTKKPGEGTGMGLSVVHGIVKSHGGFITVESEPGKGSAFHVYLPRLAAPACDVPDPEDEVPGGAERILFVDDEDMLVTMVGDMLGRLGYAMTTAAGPQEALAVFRKDPRAFDLVITDQTMPGATGLELTRELLAIRPDTPVILLTGYSEGLSPDKAAKAGVRQLIMKPVVEPMLARAIRGVLDQDAQGRT